MKKSLYIALKEVRSFLSDKGDLAFSVILPIAIFALIYGAFGGSLQFNGTAYVVNQDQDGRYSDLLISELEQTAGLTVELLSADDADRRLSRSDIQTATFIPENFSQQLEAGRQVQLVFKQRGNGGTEGQIVASIVQGEAEQIAQSIRVEQQVAAAVAGTNPDPQLIRMTVEQYTAEQQADPSVGVVETNLGSSPDPVNQFLPGILTMFVLFAINMTAQGLVEERKKGTLERMLTTSLKAGELFFGKFLAYMARGFIQTLILMLLAYAVFRLFTPVSFLSALVVALVFSAASAAIGVIIGSISRSEGQATWIGVFFTMLMVMISGTFIAITEGSVLYTASRFSINTYANEAFRTLISAGGTIGDIKIQILILFGVAVVGLVLARMLFRTSQSGK